MCFGEEVRFSSADRLKGHGLAGALESLSEGVWS